MVVVFDTNTIVSAVGFGGTPYRALVRTFSDEFVIAASEATIGELDRVLQYDSLPFTEREQELYPTLYERLARIVTPTERIEEIDADPDDNRFLECAVAANADYLVSGDEAHVQPVEEFRGTDIVSPREFLSAHPLS